ncbi:hypothetical protein JCM19238_5217 [Vibrio ponticus]|nr:hypothetical protein JCM19238_5217 [Vibrio ponticus]
MQDKGLTNFASVEEFKRAFLSAHEACLESGKKLSVVTNSCKTMKKLSKRA